MILLDSFEGSSIDCGHVLVWLDRFGSCLSTQTSYWFGWIIVGAVSGIPWSQCPIWHHVFRSKCRCNSNCSLSVRIGSAGWNQGQAYPIRISECISLPTHVVLGSIVVSISDCHSGDRGSIPRRGGCAFFLPFSRLVYESSPH